MFPHAFAEESVRCPVLRRTVPDGPALTLQIEQEHQAVNELVTLDRARDAVDSARQPSHGRGTAASDRISRRLTDTAHASSGYPECGGARTAAPPAAERSIRISGPKKSSTLRVPSATKPCWT